jgi:opacity protein-like surface antigen
MMRRLPIIAAALVFIPSALGAGSLADRLSFKLGPGGVMALGGHFTDSVRLNKAVGIGASLAAGLQYKVNDYFVLEGSATFDWMGVKKTYRPFDFKEQTPALNLGIVALNGTLFLSRGYAISPYLTLGAGLCPWQFSRKALGGGAWPAPGDPAHEFSGRSFGLNTGFGVETNLSPRLDLFVEIKYHYVFARDVPKLGTDDFTQQDFLGLGLGLVYRFGKR